MTKFISSIVLGFVISLLFKQMFGVWGVILGIMFILALFGLFEVRKD